MKIISLAIAFPVFLLSEAESASIYTKDGAIPFPVASFKSARLSEPLPLATMTRTCVSRVKPVLVRGGGSDDANEYSKPCCEVSVLASNALLHTFAALTTLNGVAYALLPQFSTKFFGEDVRPGSIEEYCQEAAGCFALELAVTGYLAASGKVGVDRAIACGTLPDLYFMTKNIVSGKFGEFGSNVRNFMIAATVVASTCTCALFTEKWHPATVAKIMTVLPAIKGLYSYIDPIGSGKKMLGADISENEKAHTLYCTSGQAKVISAFYRGSLAFGVDPRKGLGYTMLLHSVMTVERMFVRKNQDTDHAHRGNFVHLALSVFMGIIWVLAA